jgi:glycosyltransferase involved in cell wall biosynthesis
MSDILISFVVPCYNVSNYIETCIESIEESCKNISYEIIAVEDFSNDETYFRLTKLSEDNKYIKVFKNDKNEGLGQTRNIGFLQSSGKYVWFVDSDDWIDSSATTLLINEMADYDLDVLSFNLVYVDSSNNTKVHYFSSDTNVIKGIEFISNNLSKWWENGSSVNKIFKREFLISNNIIFPPLHYLEDQLFSFKVKYFSQNFKHFNADAYFYRFNENSITNSVFTHKKHIEIIKLCKYFSKFLLENSELEKNIKNSLISYIDFYLSSTFKPFLLFSAQEMNESISIYKSLNNYFIKFSNVNIFYKIIYKNKFLLIIFWYILHDFYKIIKRN